MNRLNIIGSLNKLSSRTTFSWSRYWSTRTPINFTLTILSDTESKLDWDIIGSGYDSFYIERATEDGDYSVLDSVNSDIATYSDTTADAGILYWYRLRAYNSSVPIAYQYSSYTTAVNNLTGDITTGLVGEWLLNEGTGAVATDTGGANNGTIVNSAWDTGLIGRAVSFNGTANTDGVKCGDILDTTFSGANKKFTLTARIKPAAVMTGKAILYKLFGAPDNQRQFALQLSTGSYLNFVWYGDLAGSTYRRFGGTATAITDLTKWYHITATYDGTLAIDSRAALFIDAISEAGSINLTAGADAVIQNGTAQLGIGASFNPAGTTSLSNFNGLIEYVRVYNRILTPADILADKYKGFSEPENTAKLFSYDAGSQIDDFFDTLYLESINTGTFKIHKPVRYSGNPIFVTGTNTDTWDRDKGYPSVWKIGGTYYMWYSALPVGGVPPYLQCYATSDDGITWTKPTIGVVTYDGNTNNNLIRSSGTFALAVLYDPDGDADKRYMATAGNYSTDGTWQVARKIPILKSTDGITWTLINELYPGSHYYLEGSELIKRADGRWIVYCIVGGLIDTRQVRAWLSDTTDPAGAWTDIGVVIATTVATDQKYTIGIDLINGIYYAKIANYNSTTEQIFIDLYIARDGQAWTKRSSQWIPLGASGQWDDEMLFGGKSTFIKVGNDWRFYYAATAESHAHGLPRDGRIGLATIGYKRIGGFAGNGSVITTAFTPTTPLYINADLTYGSLLVELLLAADDSVIAGYSKTDMDAITGDVYSQEITWGGNPIPSIALKIKFYLT